MLPALLAAFSIGLIRGGLKGLSPLFILLMATSFGARESSGIIVPLLLVGDVMALVAYRKHIVTAIVKQFCPRYSWAFCWECGWARICLKAISNSCLPD